MQNNNNVFADISQVGSYKQLDNIILESDVLVADGSGTLMHERVPSSSHYYGGKEILLIKPESMNVLAQNTSFQIL